MIEIKRLIIIALVCTLLCMLSLTACDNGKLDGQSELLGSPKEADKVDYSELRTDGYKAFLKSVEKFAADFAEYSFADYNEQDNFAVSPVSVFSALALAAECADGDTRAELLVALNVSREQLLNYYSTMYNSLEVERKIGNKVTGVLNLSNSIWVNKGTDVKQDCINSLSDNYYAYSYSADFHNDNINANKAVRDFVSKKTKGLIDKDFQLSKDTLCALINTLYLKTIWNTDGEGLFFTDRTYSFTSADGSVKNVKLLQGEYVNGRAAEFDDFTTFYTKTYDGYKIKFILPKDGYTLSQVFTSENIAAANSVSDYDGYDVENGVAYLTRVLFPEYKCKYDKDVKDILTEKFGIQSFFQPYVCDFSALTDEACHCTKVQHVTDLTVDKEGIEGAAVTVVEMDCESEGPSLAVYDDFIVDKAFGFIITDWQDITLFSGVVNNI